MVEIPRFARDDRGSVRIARGEVAEGVAELRGAERGPPSIAGLAELGRSYEQLGQRDSAAAVYTRYLNASYLNRVEDDAWYLPRVLQRLGVLDEEAGDAAGALAAYQRLLDLWREADPPIRARRDSVARRVATLRARGARH